MLLSNCLLRYKHTAKQTAFERGCHIVDLLCRYEQQVHRGICCQGMHPYFAPLLCELQRVGLEDVVIGDIVFTSVCNSFNS